MLITQASDRSTMAPCGTISWDQLVFEVDEDGQRVELGRGAFGSVLAAVYKYQHVAVKQLSTGGRALSQAQLEGARREAEIMGRLAHDNVVRVFGFAVEDRPGRPSKYGIVVALLHENLQALLVRVASGAHGAPDEALPLAWRLNAFHELVEGLAHLHVHRVVHGDLKPAT